MGACLCMQFRGSLAAVWAKARIAIEGDETSVPSTTRVKAIFFGGSRHVERPIEADSCGSFAQLDARTARLLSAMGK